MHTGTRSVPASAPFIDAVVAGQPVRLRLDFATHAPILLTPDAAARLALAGDLRDGRKTKLDRGVVVSRVGRQTVRVPHSTEAVTIDGVTRSLAVGRPPDLAVDHADGVILPSALPYAVVRLEQRPARPGDVETLLPVIDDGRFDGLPFAAMAGDERIRAELAPSRAASIATAATGGALALIYGGKLTGPLIDAEVAYGVKRPTRLLRLDRPWTAAGVPVTAMLMRVHDWEGRVPEPLDADIEETVIQVNARHNAQRGLRLMKLGADVLGNCAMFEWRRAENVLAVRCPAVRR